MFNAIFGSKSAERVLVYINTRGGGYGREIAAFYGGSLTSIQRQLDKLENANVLYAEQQGKTRVYRLNPKYALYPQLQQLLDKAVEFYPPAIRDELLMNRRRPRRTGKPIQSV
ncbi:winged helix-turn-helix domain-containing protein [Dasania marina]|uniref:winged helix-turn-helix domain-containing protein n=1 Tax=Dasania marina TaxID=471499 RepID=UPI0003764666|nr:winged helix-turn-helix domain-containing protein [Dasania marina]